MQCDVVTRCLICISNEAKYLNKERSDNATKKIQDKFSFFGTLTNKTSQIMRVMLRLYFQTKLIIYRRAQIFIRAIRGGGGVISL